MSRTPNPGDLPTAAVTAPTVTPPTVTGSGPLAGDSIIGQPQGRPFLPLLVLAWFGATLAPAAIAGAAIPKWLTLVDASSKESNFAIISAVGGIVVMLATPLLGRLSDRTMLRWGMRKPWILAGLVVGSIGAGVMAAADSVWFMAVAWAIIQVGYGAVNMAAHALLADQVPGRIRARVAAAVGVAGGISTILAAATVAALPISAPHLWFLVPAALGAVLVAPLLFGYRDAVRVTAAPALNARTIVSTYWLNPVLYRDFAWAWVSRFFMSTSIISVSSFLFFLIVDTLGFTAEQAGGVQTMALACFFAGNIVATVFFGWLSDKLRRRKIIIWISGVVSAAGLTVMAFSPGLAVFLLGLGIVGFAQGAYICVDVALMTEVLPSTEDAGKDLGIVALSYQLPGVFSPVLGAAAIDAMNGSYRGLYVFAIVCSALGGLAIIKVRGVR